MVILFMQYLIIFLISMVPLIELRGAIPYAIGFKLPLLPSYIICILGNMLPVPFIFLFARKILVWGSDKKYIGGFFNWCLKKGEKGGKKLQEKGARNVLISMAGEGAVLVSEDKSVFMAEAPKGTLINGVGAGDSMVAGFLAGWMKSHDYKEAFRMGVACGSASAFSEYLADSEMIEKVYNQVQVNECK